MTMQLFFATRRAQAGLAAGVLLLAALFCYLPARARLSVAEQKAQTQLQQVADLASRVPAAPRTSRVDPLKAVESAVGRYGLTSGVRLQPVADPPGAVELRLDAGALDPALRMLAELTGEAGGLSLRALEVRVRPEDGAKADLTAVLAGGGV